jgi:hypothetical protein
VWIDPPEYYDPPGGLLTFAIDQPEQLVRPAGGMSVQGHVDLMHHQLRQLRAALALAHALGRVLVLPAVVCGYDKYWGPLLRKGDGVIPGTHPWVLPIFNCPLDHYIEVGQLDPVQTVREYSFMDNPRTPAAVRQGVRSAPLAEAGPTLERLAGHTDKVLDVGRVVGIDPLENGLLSKEQRRAFKQRFGNVGGSWCCSPMDEKKQGAPHSVGFRLMKV